MKSIVLRLTICTLAVFTVAGCASFGNDSIRNETESSINSKIAENKTTKGEIKNMFGTPVEVDYTDSGLEIWRYKYVETSNEGLTFLITLISLSLVQFGDVESRELTILFDEKGVVKKYSVPESTLKRRGGVIK